MSHAKTPFEISVRVNNLTQLFHSLDPSPFRDRDLTPQAEDFITNWARTAPKDAPLRLTISVPEEEIKLEHAEQTPRAVQKFFEIRADQARHDLSELFREGRRAALVGVPLLIACIVLSEYITSRVEEPALIGVIGQSLLILGWVANWRPIQIFLYDWWPILRRRKFYERLSQAEVRIEPV